MLLMKGVRFRKAFRFVSFSSAADDDSNIISLVVLDGFQWTLSEPSSVTVPS